MKHTAHKNTLFLTLMMGIGWVVAFMAVQDEQLTIGYSVSLCTFVKML